MKKPPNALDYESRVPNLKDADRDDLFVDGDTLYVRDGCYLPRVCIRCGRTDDLVCNTHYVRNTSHTFAYFLCAQDHRSRQTIRRVIAILLLVFSGLYVALRIAAAVSPTLARAPIVSILVIGLLLALAVTHLAAGSATFFTLRPMCGNHIGVKVDPTLLPYMLEVHRAGVPSDDTSHGAANGVPDDG